MNIKVAVIGAGVVGMSTAVVLQERIHQAEVTVIAEEFLEKTLSYGAGALFRGDASIHHDLKLNETWLQASHTHFSKLANMAEQAAQQKVLTEEEQNANLKNSESLASSILSLKPSSVINSSSQTANDLENLSLHNGNSENASPTEKSAPSIIEETKLKDSNQSIPKLIMETTEADDLANNNSSSTADLNKLNLTSNDSSNSLNVKSSNSRSPSPCRSGSCRSKSPNQNGKELPEHGIRLVHGYHLTEVCENAVGNELMSKLVNDWRSLSIEELAKLTPNIRFKYGYEYSSIIIEPGTYLRYLMAKFHSNKGQLLKRTISFRSINDFDFLHRNFHVVFNCTGLGAKQLMSDHQMVPIRGQTVIVRADWIKSFYTFDSNYIYPRYDGSVVLGGCKQYGNWSQQLNDFDRQAILAKCSQLLPELTEAEVIGEFCGLRPHRAEIRVERERIYSPDKENQHDWLNVIHNYGHGGNGFTYSYGTALHAVKLIDDLVHQCEH